MAKKAATPTTVTLKHLAAAIAEEQELSKKQAEAILNDMVGRITKHLKIVVVALVAGIAVAGFGIAARSNVDYSQSAQVIKAGKAVVITSSGTSTVR